jgi:drug/metabolite transporter (DMT)-like permease
VLAGDGGGALLQPRDRAPFAVVTWGSTVRRFQLVASGALELVYFLTLTAAYQRAELSLVYPLARGGAPVLVLLGAVVTGYDPSRIEVAGVLAVAAGVVLVRGLRGGDRLGVALGLLIAAQIAAYTLVDAEGIQGREDGAVPAARSCRRRSARRS